MNLATFKADLKQAITAKQSALIGRVILSPEEMNNVLCLIQRLENDREHVNDTIRHWIGAKVRVTQSRLAAIMVLTNKID